MRVGPFTSKPIIVLAIIKINIAVFILWLMLGFYAPDFMIKNFLVSWSGVLDGRIWTLVTSVFSHNMFFHIFINMYAFFGFGAVVENILGPKRFFIFYLWAGIFSSLCHCLVSTYLIGDNSIAALGASGAISGVILLFSLLFPTERILLMGIFPIPALWASIFIIGLDLWGLFEQTKGVALPIGHGAHLGGALYGGAYYLIKMRKSSGNSF